MFTEKEKVMSHPDPCFDPDNSHEEDGMVSNFTDYHYDYSDDFYGDEPEMDDNDFYDDYDDSMDGDHDSAMESAGWGTDEDYGYYGEDF
jgi:hypothetical protein